MFSPPQSFARCFCRIALCEVDGVLYVGGLFGPVIHYTINPVRLLSPAEWAVVSFSRKEVICEHTYMWLVRTNVSTGV